MMVHIPQVLSPEQVAECRQLLQQAQWVDGKATAGFQSAMTKDNLQLPQDCPQAKAMHGCPSTGWAQTPTPAQLQADLFQIRPAPAIGGACGCCAELEVQANPIAQRGSQTHRPGVRQLGSAPKTTNATRPAGPTGSTTSALFPCFL